MTKTYTAMIPANTESVQHLPDGTLQVVLIVKDASIMDKAHLLSTIGSDIKITIERSKPSYAQD